MSDRLIVLSTVRKREDALRLARALVEQGLAACVNVVPGVTSVYRWKGKLEVEPERLLVIKTHSERFEALRAALVSQHPYEVPEVLALPLAGGHAPYLAWLDECLGVRNPGRALVGRPRKTPPAQSRRERRFRRGPAPA